VLSSSTPYPDEILAEVFANGGEGAQMEKLMQQLIRGVVRANKPGAVSKIVQQIAANSGAKIAPWKMQALASLIDAQKSDVALNSPELQKIFSEARSVAANSSASSEDRRMAAQLLGRGSNSEEITVLGNLLSASNPLPLQRTALDRLAESSATNAPQIVLGNWSKLGPQMRSLVLAQTLKRAGWTQALFDKIQSGALPRTELNAAIQQQLLTHPSKPIRDRAAQLLSVGVASSERDPVVKDYLVKVRRLQGDADKGRVVFETHCAVCHKAGKLGYGSGPDLGMIYDNSVEQLVTAILDPNRAVEDRYRSYTAQTKQGEEVSGLLLNETGNSVTIMGLTGVEQTILRENIASLTSNNRSLMPEGFEQFLQPQDIANVISFLRANAVPPKSFPGNMPALVRADEQGQLHLTANRAELYGDSIAFEQQYGNLGTWHAKTDHAVWAIEIPKEGTFDLWLDFACAKGTEGNKFSLKIGDQVLTGTVPSTSTWDDYQQRKFGRLKLKAGEHRAVFSPDPSLQQYLIDLREVRLVPEGSGPPSFSPERKQTSVEGCCDLNLLANTL
jgi:putative heme-binding domain-containing protein